MEEFKGLVQEALSIKLLTERWRNCFLESVQPDIAESSDDGAQL